MELLQGMWFDELRQNSCTKEGTQSFSPNPASMVDAMYTK
jgi:hypothetical protein